MRFVHPWLLSLLLAVPLVGLFAVYLRARREKALALLTLNPPKAPLAGVQAACMLVGLALVIFSASRPQWGQRDAAGKIVRLSRNAIIVLDVSRSMLAEDVGSRLGQAKTGAAELIGGLLATNGVSAAGGSCALVTFAGSGTILCPLTDDRAFLERTLSNLSELSAKGGNTSIASGIERALELIPGEDGTGPKTERDTAIVLLSDGGDLEGRALAAAETAKSRGVPILAVGVGRADVASPIPWRGRTLVDNGREVLVKLEPATLRAIAEKSGGDYIELGAERSAGRAGRTLYDIYDDFIHHVAIEEQAEEDMRAGQSLTERFQWFLVPGLALLILGAACSKGRFRRSRDAQSGKI
ncbi:MAG: VWA domain-containing protein [Kiritimatiellae bacterium]|nr:VWA domain-containing protein [Kiritimatiellia bacterium]